VFVRAAADINAVSLSLPDNPKDGLGLVGVGSVKAVIAGSVFNSRKAELSETRHVAGLTRKPLYGTVYNLSGST
jgi:hypothetical protein